MKIEARHAGAIFAPRPAHGLVEGQLDHVLGARDGTRSSGCHERDELSDLSPHGSIRAFVRIVHLKHDGLVVLTSRAVRDAPC
jgi:hypothetical protein